MGEGNRGGVRLGFDAVGQRRQQGDQLVNHQVECVAQPQGIDIVQHIHRRGAEMNDRAADRTLFGIGLDLSHQVVANFLLDGLGAGDVDVVLVRAQIGDLRGADQPGRVLCLGQRHPDTTQQPALVRLAPQPAHCITAVTPGERGKIGLMIEHGYQNPSS